MKILALGAHPDDIEIFMFGTMTAYAALGAELSFAIATDGARGGTGGDPAALAKARRSEAAAAAGLLGVTPRFMDFPDGSLVADAALIAALKALIGEIEPDLAITHAPNDYHGDHRALSDGMRIAASFAVPVLHADTLGGTGFSPTHYVEISHHWDVKAKAIRAHRSQGPEHYVDRARIQNEFRAGQCNGGPGALAEAFRFEPVFPFADIRALLPPAPPLRPVMGSTKPVG
ncbi:MULTISPECIES: PIG-L deacetylase family protein [unclassified Mesorhizobium]|uniref:PIG-L deacetylase family protein n=1 Tax=unclassified Mesorhizobium TaxID=325217 RepID=UPI000BAFBF92|nr:MULTISPECIES: PIG-L deacetylase family protein [unclassified Mesorhizobium]TGT60860.1 PIG-L family deacetylase [Mesorhizobium sp. M00.F.Ca.ET.170.01.1.1]AZO10037.1 PIG-L family deacetylase [Mesorhizobium sp. M3A.F.Ca.ET.080.04.2.1]PBB86497.1 PIG-L domain-containing protein [Mesorhizobium sp. WSM3876]RWB75723.1 MAG: PIG-L family deacetylase [Mesorhizobium sp.]RWB91476.1 MAG: PIG-L family deacetylase [Mesorhizobium sp.]